VGVSELLELRVKSLVHMQMVPMIWRQSTERVVQGLSYSQISVVTLCLLVLDTFLFIGRKEWIIFHVREESAQFLVIE